MQRSARAGAVRRLALLTDGGRYVYAAGSSYLDAGSGSPDNDFTNRAPRFTTSNLMHLAWMLKQVGGTPARRCSVPVTSPGKALGLLRWSGPVLTGRPAAGYGEIPAPYVIGKGVGDSCNGTG